MATGITGIGTKLERSDMATPTEVYAAIARVFNISGPGMSREIVDTTTFDSVSGYRDKIGGLKDGGTVTFTLNFLRATYILLKEDFEDDDPRNYRIVLPDTEETTLTFSGLITELPLTVPEGDRITCDVTIEISGAVAVSD